MDAVAEQRTRIIEYLKAQPTANVWEIFAACTQEPFAVAYNELRRSEELAVVRGDWAVLKAWHTPGMVVEGVFGGLLPHGASDSLVASVGGKFYTIPRNLHETLDAVAVGTTVRIEYIGVEKSGQRKMFKVVTK